MLTTMVRTITPIASRPHTVAWFPATVDGTEGFVVIQPDANTTIVSIAATRHDAAGQQNREQTDRESDC